VVNTGRENGTVVAYIVERKKEDEIIVDLVDTPSGEPLFDVIKLVLEDKGVPDDIEIISDNIYVVKTMTIYAPKWEKTGYTTTKGGPVRDEAIIKELMGLPQPRYKYMDRKLWPKGLDGVEDLIREEGESQAEIRRQKEKPKALKIRGRSETTSREVSERSRTESTTGSSSRESSRTESTAGSSSRGRNYSRR
jgi:hypothetical protein